MRIIATLEQERYRRYQTSSKGKATSKRYRQSLKGKTTKSRWRKLYRKLPYVIEKQRAYAKSKRDRTNELRRAYRSTSQGKASVQRENKRRSDKKLQWGREHRDVCRLQCVRRRARMWNAVVPGMEKAILRIYTRAKQLRAWFDVVVDHIVPLSRGGLHVPRNLQIIYRSENAAKNNQLDYNPRVIFS